MGVTGKRSMNLGENVRFKERPVPASARACLPSLGMPGMQGMELRPRGVCPPKTPELRWGSPGYALPFFDLAGLATPGLGSRRSSNRVMVTAPASQAGFIFFINA